MTDKKGVLLVLTGPTGVGKDAVIEKLLSINPNFKRVITTTTRPKRKGEKEAEPYHFLTRLDFERKIKEDAFFEYVEFRKEYYGTQKDDLLPLLEKGIDVIWKIETQGVKNVREQIERMIPQAVFVFLTVSDINDLRIRVIKADGEEDGAKRFDNAPVEWEMEQKKDYDHVVLNDNGMLDIAVKKINDIIDSQRV